jgi:hypothetical protein
MTSGLGKACGVAVMLIRTKELAALVWSMSRRHNVRAGTRLLVTLRFETRLRYHRADQPALLWSRRPRLSGSGDQDRKATGLQCRDRAGLINESGMAFEIYEQNKVCAM